MCSVAKFDRSLPAGDRAAVENDETLTVNEKIEKVRKLEMYWS